MTPSSPDRERVEKLAEDFVRRYRAGEGPSIEDCAAAHPEHAAEIRELFPSLVLMEELGPSDDSPASVARPPPAGVTAAPLLRLGGYRILRQVGRGGMGVVYEAEQESLGRRVALKVLSTQSAADPRAQARFRRESRAVAHLHHTNIVPVFEVGQEGGVCFFAMQFIQGQALDQVLKELRRLRSGGAGMSAAGAVAHSLWTEAFAAPDAGAVRKLEPTLDGGDTEPVVVTSAVLPGRAELSGVEANYGLYCRNVARIGLQAADALAHAHARGIVHRDIKPSNLLLDTAGVVWVSDFGLARTVDSGLTEPGEIVGTLRYMPPERFRGECDARSDVYSLGLTLYELLTLRPPFDGSDRLRLIEQITRQEPVRPRARERRIPRDLETVVLKAMDKDPARRYPSANDLAADLGRFLADEPVRARRAGATERLWRLGRRNPVIAGLSVAVAALLAVSLVVLIVAALIGQERDRAVQAEQRAVAAEQENKILEHLARATAVRRSGQVGQRFNSLEEIRKALDLGPSAELRVKLRDEAAAALVLPDVGVAREWEAWPADALYIDFDASLQRYARLDKQGGVTVCRLTDAGEEVLVRLPPRGKLPYKPPVMSPDGRFVMVQHTSSQGTAGAFFVLKLDGNQPAVFDVPASVYEYAVAFHPDGRHLAVGHVEAGGGSVGIYDLETGQPCRKLRLEAPPFHLAFHPRDGRLAVACGLAVRIFDTDTGREVRRLRHPAKAKFVSSVAWHPDGRRLATGCLGRNIYLWDAETAAEVMPPWAIPGGMVTWMGFNHTGDRLVSYDSLPHLWDAAGGRLLLTAGEAIHPRFSPDDSLIGWSHRGTKLRLWRVAAGRELHVLRRRGAASDEHISGPVMHADGRIPVLAANSDDYLRMTFFDLLRGEELASVPLPEAERARLNSFDPIAGGWETAGAGGLCYWPTRPDPARAGALRVGPPLRRASAPGGPEQVGLSQDRRVMAFPQPFQDHALLLHKDRPGRRIVLQPQFDVRSAAVSPDGRWVVTCSWFGDSRSSAQIWEGDSGRHVQDLPLTGTAAAGFSPDGRWLGTFAWGLGTRLWEVGSWRETQRFDDAQFAFSPDSRLLALNDVGGVIRLVATDGREVARLTGSEPAWYLPACFSPDGTRLVATAVGGKALYVWDLRLIRQQLKAMDLDWEWPEFPPAPAAEKPVTSVTVDTGELGDPREEVAVYSLSLALQPINPEAYLRRGRAWSRLQQHPQAIADYSAFLLLASSSDSRRAEVLFRRAMLSKHLKDHPAVLADLHALVQLDLGGLPWRDQLALVCNNEAWRWSTSSAREPELAKALALARKATELAPGNVTHRNTLGVVYYRLDRWREAVATLEQNLKDNADQAAFDLYFLAMSHHRLGDRARASDCFERAARWHDDRAAGLPASHRAELKAFRAEAEALMREPQR